MPEADSDSKPPAPPKYSAQQEVALDGLARILAEVIKRNVDAKPKPSRRPGPTRDDLLNELALLLAEGARTILKERQA